MTTATPTPTVRTDEQLLADVRTVAERVGGPMSWNAYNANRDEPMLNSHTIMRRLGLTWAGLCERAGVAPGVQSRPAYSRRFTDDDLRALVRQYLADDSALLTYADFTRWCAESDERPGAQTFRNAFGKWSDVKAAGA